ncbi:hypothetical protein FEE95_12815 [Maribacter algarum]|uniref:Uncharacterized protein n=1 Tax=Maribacter algarum (ex Zhang et al. 2020) TaxID=2578118 RepID=A0A5S3PRJ4_9FLAO|nr:hypothetical protein [Maribacter algarum]TMM57360.1 hypothetical protein FEE95_12815 [Maribacter algarum]
MSVLKQMASSKVLYSLLGLSVLFFLVKGVTYASIGSYVPILFITIAIIILGWSFTRCNKVHRHIIRFWAILIILWASIRLVLWIVLEIDTTLTESHLREQFGIVQNIISLLMLLIGIKIIREVKQRKLN